MREYIGHLQNKTYDQPLPTKNIVVNNMALKNISERKTKVEKFDTHFNSGFGKMLNDRNRSRCDVVTDIEQLAQIICDPNYTFFTVSGPDIVLLNRKKKRIK
jgi:hypothetical protein